MTTTTQTLNNTLKRVTATTLAIILAITLTPIVPTQAHAASLSTATPVATQDVTAAGKYAITADCVTTQTLTYTGKKLKPKVTVKVQTGTQEVEDWQDGVLNYTDGKPDMKTVPAYTTLKQGRDYTLTIKNSKGKKVSKPKARGTYKAIVTGKGAYTGTVTKSFKVAKETVYFTTCQKTKYGTAAKGSPKNRLAYGLKYKDTSDTSGVLSMKGYMYKIPRNWVKFEITKNGNAFAGMTEAYGKSKKKLNDKKKVKKVKAKSFKLTSETQCYEIDGDNFLKGDPSKHYRLAGKEATLCRDGVLKTTFRLIVVVRDNKVIKIAVTGHKASISNGYGW